MKTSFSLVVLALCLQVGCTVSRGAPCGSDSDCNAGMTCVSGRCAASDFDGGTMDGGNRTDAQHVSTCPGGGTTSVSGVVRIPAGTLPVPGAIVYVASGPVADIPTGVDGTSCLRCDAQLSNVVGQPTTTHVDGTFTLNDVPAGDDVRIVVQIGKWRREAIVPHVTLCEDNPLDPEMTRLPRNHMEGHLPRIALTTGSCDGMECLLRKLGIDDSEFTNPDGGGRVSLFADTVCTNLPPPFPMVCESGRNRYDDSLGGEMFPDAVTWWSSLDNLDDYDVVIHSCECSETMANKPAEALTALQQYADHGGRVFLTHYHYAWLKFSTDDSWRALATWNGSGDFPTATGQIDTSFDRGAMLADWLQLPEVGGTTTRGSIPLQDAKQSLTALGDAAQPWITIGGTPAYFSFDTPFNAPDADECGRVVFSDIHVSAADQAQSNPNPFMMSDPAPFPQGCTDTLLPQEKALIFLLFDLTNCVGPPIPF
jgi:hypothetical protein